MLILLPPSETKRPGGRGAPLDVGRLALPALAPQRDRVVDALVVLAAPVEVVDHPGVELGLLGGPLPRSAIADTQVGLRIVAQRHELLGALDVAPVRGAPVPEV